MPLQPPRCGAWGARPVEVEDIPAEAKAITMLLDKAATDIEQFTGPRVDKYVQELDRLIDLVQRIQQQQSLQVASVAAALAPLRAAVGSLEQILLGVSVSGASRQLAKAVNEVCQAGKNLQEQLPGDFARAVNNEASGAVQINAAVGGARQDRRLIVEAAGNKASDAAQVNAPVFGNNALDGIAKIMAAMQAAKA